MLDGNAVSLWVAGLVRNHGTDGAIAHVRGQMALDSDGAEWYTAALGLMGAK